MSFGDLVKKANDEKDKKKTSSFAELVKKANNGTNVGTAVDATGVDSWFQSVSSVSKKAYDYLSVEGYKKADDSLLASIDSYLSSAGDIRQFISANRMQINDYDNIYKDYANAVSTLRSLRDQLQKSNKLYSKYDTEDAYNKAMMGWLDESSESTPEQVAARQAQYKSNQDRVTQIEEDLPWYAKTWLPNWAEDIFLSKEKEALRDEAEGLEAENTQYERLQGKTDKHYMPVTPEFTQGAANRNFSNASKEDLRYHDSQFLDYETKWNNYSMAGSMGEDGAILDPTGRVVYAANDYSKAYIEGTKDSFYNAVVQDKLGMFLAATDEDYNEAFATIAGGVSNDTWANLILEGENNAWKQLTEHEINTYYYYLNMQGQAAAYQYLEDMTVTLTKRATEQRAKEYDEASTLEKIALNIASIPMNVFGGAVGLIGDAANAIEGKEYNPYSAAHSWTNDANAIRYNTAMDINEATGNASLPLIGTTWGDVYQSLMSSADSLAGAALGGGTYGVLMGTGAAHSTMKDLYERGASTEKMVVGGVLAGAFEMFFEKHSIDKLVSIKDTKTFKTLLVNTLKQGGIEASEEAFTEIANLATDYVLMGSQSTWSTSGDNFGERLGEAAKSVAQAGVGGFISGGFSGGLFSTADYAKYNMNMTQHGAEILARDGADPLKQLALEMAAQENGLNAKSLTKAAGKVTDAVTKKNANKLGRLSDLMGETVSAQDVADVKAALVEKGISEKDAKRYAAYLVNDSKLDQKDKAKIEAEIKNNDKVKEVVKEILDNPTSAAAERQTKLLAARLGVRTTTPTDTLTGEKTTSGSVALRNDVDVKDKVSESNETIRVSTGEAIKIDKNNAIAKTKVVDGKRVVYYNTDKGVVEASDIAYASEEEGLIYEAFADMNPAFANAIIKNYDGSIPVQTYINGMREGVVLYGMHNFQAVGKDISVNTFLAELSEADQAFALKLGRAYAKANANKGSNAIHTALKNAEEKAKAAGEDTSTKNVKGGRVSFESGTKATTKSQRRAVQLAKILSKAIGIDIVFYDARTTTDKRGLKANGFFDPKTNSIHLDLQNADSDTKTIAFTLSHELVHFIKKWSPTKFNTFAKFLMEQYAEHGVSTEQLLANKMAEIGTTNTDKAFEELVADACERMLLDSNAVVKLAQLRQTDAGLFNKIKEHILNILRKIRGEYESRNLDNTTDEGQALQGMKDVMEQMYSLFEDAAVDAAQTYQTAKSLNVESLTVTEEGTIQLQMKQYKETGRSTLLNYLREQYGDNNANDLIATIDSIYNVMAEIKEDTALSVFGNWQDTEVELDADGHPIFTTSINNGDYELNQDFSRVCKKRRQLNFVLNMLAEDPAFEASNLTKQDFVKINKAIKEHGFEIACALCFVDSKRFRQAEWADSFANTWNDILGSIKADDKSLSRFNFATKSVNMADEGVQIDETKPISYRKWSEGKVTETRTFKNIHDLLANDGNNNVRAIARLLLENPNLRHEFRGADIIASDGFDMIQRLAPDVRGILDGWGGSSVPKPSSNDAIYDNSVLNIAGYNAKKAFAVGGVRMNSFSDFMAHMFFDYAQAFADLSAKGLPMHSYTKELDFARLFGLTGGKINMSAIAAIRKNAADLSKIKRKVDKEAATEYEKSIAGLDISRLAEKLGKEESAITYDDVIENLDDVDYVWADESIDVKKATLLQTGILYDKLSDAQADYCYELIRNGQIDEAFRVAGEENVNKGYAKHLGIITVGVSKAHILKLLRDPTIRMVIPYHRSGLNPAVAKALNIAFYDDFTDSQNTSFKKNGKQVGITKDDAKVKWKNPKNGKMENKKLNDFCFYDYFGKTIDGVFYDGKATAAKYLDWCENGVYDETVGDYVYYISGGGYILASDLHAQGVEIIPKFSEFASEENYYKLVEDFDCYDTITGEHSAQEAVDLFHDGLPSDYKDVLVKALKAEQQVSDDFRDHLDNQGLRDEIMAIVGKNGYAPSDLAATWGDIIETVGKENVAEATEQLTDVENTMTVKQQKKKNSDSTYEAIGKELLYYEEGDLAPDLTLVETVNERTGSKEVTIKHYGQKPKGYIPRKIAYCYKLFEQHPDGTLHALFAGAKNAVPIGEWRYAQGFPRTDSGVNGMNLRERYGWHLSAGLPSAPHLMSSKSFERGYPSKNAYGHPKGSKRVWVRMAYDASTDFNAIADSTGRQNDIYGLIPFGGYYAFKENNQSEWVISSAVKIDKILDEADRQQILKEAGYDEREEWRLKYQPTPEERAARDLANKERAKAKARAKKLGIDTELSESTKAMRDSIKSRIIDNPELSDGVKKQLKKTSDKDYLDAVNRGDMVTAQRMVAEVAKAAGYDSPLLYHGTDRFGFTVAKTTGVEDGVEWSPLFASNKQQTSASYTNYGRVREISQQISEDDYDTAMEDVNRDIDDEIANFRLLIDRTFSEWYFGQQGNGYLRDAFDNAREEAGYGDGVYDVFEEIIADAYYKYGDSLDEAYSDFDEWLEESEEGEKLIGSVQALEGLRTKQAQMDATAIEDLGGIYQLYANTQNLFELDGNGANWNNLRSDKLPPLSRHGVDNAPYKTRDVAEWARTNGYDGVVFKNIRDSGKYGDAGLSDVYVFFSPESQVKSADPVTYDNNGNVIPLSERFNSENDDIRYQKKRNPSEYAPVFYSQMGKVIEGIKMEKIGTASVINFLKGKGIRHDEIKWSGIEAFLEGKRSVTKAELQQFVAGSMLRISERLRSDKELPYTDSQKKRLSELEPKRDTAARKLSDEWKRIVGEEIPFRNFGAGIDSDVAKKIMEINLEYKRSTFEGRLLAVLRENLISVIERNDNFGFDTWRDALVSVHRHRKDFAKQNDMPTADKAVIVKYCNALEAFNQLDPKISDEDSDTLRGLAEETHSLSVRIHEVKMENYADVARYRPNWKQYSLKGGENYRELMFFMPNSDYSNDAMETHWGLNEHGVLAHARIQDFDTPQGKMLFIEEIQSDWHNEGHTEGYADTKKAEALRKKAAELDKKNKAERAKVTAALAAAMEGKVDNPESAAKSFIDFGITNQTFFQKYAEKYSIPSEIIERIVALRKSRDEASFTHNEASNLEEGVPDAPFSDTYHEYVLKRLIRMAAEEGYDLIGWTPAEIQDERWKNAEYHEEGEGKSGFLKGYTIEYDQEIPKFLRKYGKKWGATVGTSFIKDNNADRSRLEEDLEDVERDIEQYRDELDDDPTEDYADFLRSGISGLTETAEKLREQLRGTEVWSMPITEQMEQSVLYEGQPLYQKKKLSNRTILANALESAIDTSTQEGQNELANLKKYQAIVGKIEELEAKRAELSEKAKEIRFKKGRTPDETKRMNAIQFEANQTANRINTYDRQLLRLEAMSPVKKVLEREKEMVRKRTEQKGREKLDAVREKNAETVRNLLKHVRETREKGVDSRHRTAMRSKIKDVVQDLHTMLTKQTKERHVPEELKAAVADVLEAINMDNFGADKRLGELYEKLQKVSDPFEQQRLLQSYKWTHEKGESVKAKLVAFKEAYNNIKNAADPELQRAFDEEVSAMIESVKDSVKDTPLIFMSLEQLNGVYKMFSIVRATIRDVNKSRSKRRKDGIEAWASKVMEEEDNLPKKAKPLPKKKNGKERFSIRGLLRKLNWNNQKPIYAMQRIGSKAFAELYEDVRDGEDTWARDVMEARLFYIETCKKHGYNSWDLTESFTFKSITGKEFEISMDMIMSLYAYSKRGKQAIEHITGGGIVLDDGTGRADTYQITEVTLAEIISKLKPEMVAFADDMQAYLSDVMGEKGNEVSMELYDIKLFTEKFYFPLKSSKTYMEKSREQDQSKGEVKIKNFGFTKVVSEGAKNPIVLSSFVDVWANHVNEMSMYHAFVIPLEDFYRVYNYHTPYAKETEGVRGYIQNSHGEAAVQYIDQLLKDLNGGAVSDPRENWAKGLMTKFKKAATMLSLSTIIQQPTSIVRAMALIDAKYFASKPTKRKHSETWEEVKKYAPVAVIKEMGYFDTNMGRSATDFITGQEYHGVKEKFVAFFKDGSYRDEIFSKAPALADELAWCGIWQAVKRETMHNRKDLSPTSEEFLKICGERFTEVITKTQVYDSVLSRSGNMRSKSVFMNMVTAFMGEPTTSLNMVQDAILKIQRGDKKGGAKVISSVIGSVVLNAALVSLVYAMRDDDEDETYTEKYVSRFSTELIDGLNPLTYIPIVKDVWSIAQGFDVERTDMSLLSDLVDSLQSVIRVSAKDTDGMSEEQLEEHEKSVLDAWLSVVDTVGNLAGLPLKNLRREVESYINFGKTIGKDTTERDTTFGSLMDKMWEEVKNTVPVLGWFPDASKTDKLYDAILDGDTEYVDRLNGSYKSDSAYDSAIRKALRENDPRIKEAAQAMVDGNISKYEKLAKEILNEGHFDKEDIKAAIKAEVNAMTPKEEEEDAADDEEISFYEMDHFYTTVMQGNVSYAYAIREDIIQTKVANGKSLDDAEYSFNSSFRNRVEKEYNKGALTDSEAANMLVSYGGLSGDDAAEKVQYWSFKQEYPEYELSESAVTKYYAEVASYGIPVATYYDYKVKTSGIKGDKDKNGNTISGSLKEKVMAVINSLPISNAQKDALYFAEGWSKSTLYEAPWH